MSSRYDTIQYEVCGIPSANLVEAFLKTQALSTPRTKASASESLSVTMLSVCPLKDRHDTHKTVYLYTHNTYIAKYIHTFINTNTVHTYIEKSVKNFKYPFLEDRKTRNFVRYVMK